MGIPIGRYIGDLVSTDPTGKQIVDKVKTGIKIVKDADLKLGPILRDAGAAAIDAAAARVKEEIERSKVNYALEQVKSNIVPILLGGFLLLLILRRR